MLTLAYLYNGYGINEGEDAPKPCTFTYNGVKYAGLKWASAASLDSIKTLIYDISTTGLPFYVKYSSILRVERYLTPK